MRTLNSVMGTLCACILLANCAYFEDSAAPAETIDLTTRSLTHGQAVTPQETSNAIALISNISSSAQGSVEVFSLDNPGQRYETPAAAVHAAAHPSALAPRMVASRDNNASVQLFSFGADPVPTPSVTVPVAAPLTPMYRSAPIPTANHSSAKAAKVYFAHGVKSISKDGMSVLSRISEEMAGKKQPIYVSGHASERAEVSDPTARKIANLKTSMDRAFAVTRTLIKQGVPAENIETTAWGETRPAPATDTMDAETASRRVEISAYRMK